MIDGLFDDIFTKEEFLQLNNVSKNSVNVEALEKTGNVVMGTIEQDGYITETVNYESFCGKINFTKIHTYLKHNQDTETIKQLTEQLNIAVKQEEYIKAQEIKNKLDKLKQLQNK